MSKTQVPRKPHTWASQNTPGRMLAIGKAQSSSWPGFVLKRKGFVLKKASLRSQLAQSLRPATSRVPSAIAVKRVPIAEKKNEHMRIQIRTSRFSGLSLDTRVPPPEAPKPRSPEAPEGPSLAPRRSACAGTRRQNASELQPQSGSQVGIYHHYYIYIYIHTHIQIYMYIYI